MQQERTLQCRHQFDLAMANRLKELILNLDNGHQAILRANDIDPSQYSLLLNSAIQSIRGTLSADYSEKARYLAAILDDMQDKDIIRTWEFQGGGGRNDYRVELANGRLVAIEMKGCPDGNNMNIWERPSWADEFIIWSQCPNSLANEPGRGVWSGISTRLMTKVVVEQVLVDALVFSDGRCGSSVRKCPKHYGNDAVLRQKATDIIGDNNSRVLPTPCIFLFPRTIPHSRTNPNPPTHDLSTCQFSKAILKAFNVPNNEMQNEVHWVRVDLRANETAEYKRTKVGWGLSNEEPDVEGKWVKIKRE